MKSLKVQVVGVRFTCGGPITVFSAEVGGELYYFELQGLHTDSIIIPV